MYKNNLSKMIEITRKELKKLIDEKGTLTDPEVTKKSKELDNLLNQYIGLSSTGEENKYLVEENREIIYS